MSDTVNILQQGLCILFKCVVATVGDLFGDADDISSDEEDKEKRSVNGDKDEDSQVYS